MSYKIPETVVVKIFDASESSTSVSGGEIKSYFGTSFINLGTVTSFPNFLYGTNGFAFTIPDGIEITSFFYDVDAIGAAVKEIISPVSMFVILRLFNTKPIHTIIKTAMISEYPFSRCLFFF